MANPRYGTTVPNVVLEIAVDKAVRRFWVESVDGADVVWFTIDGSTPTALTDGTSFLSAAAGASVPFETDRAELVTVKFRSASAVKVSVRYQA